MSENRKKVVTLGYMIFAKTDKGSFPIMIDSNGKWWRGGTESIVAVGIWKNRKDAGKYCNKIRRDMKQKNYGHVHLRTFPVHFTSVFFDGKKWMTEEVDEK